MAYTVADLELALKLPAFDAEAAQEKMMPVPRARLRPPERAGTARLGSVLALLYPRHGELHLLLTKRRDDLSSHAGQVSLPGGRRDGEETLLETALRETEEETGVSPAGLRVVGQLAPLYIFPSDFEVHPFVAVAANGFQPRFRPNPGEVAEIIEAPLARLLDPRARVEELRDLHGVQVLVPYFALGRHKIWGATAMMISELVERVRASIDNTL